MKKIKNILILAGGNNIRFWPLEEKILTPFLGKSFILNLVENMLPYGEHIYVVCSKTNRNAIKQLIGDKVQIILQDQKAGGMAGAIIACKNIVQGETLVIGNDVFDFSVLKELIQHVENRNIDLVFLAKKIKTYFPGGYLELKDGKLMGIIEKPSPDKVPSDLVELVSDYFKNVEDFIAILEKTATITDDHYEQGMNTLIKSEKADFIPYESYWLTLKYPWHILPLTNFFLNKIKSNRIDKTTIISKNAIIVPPVYLGKKVKIGDFAKVVGPTFIGDGSVVADHTLIYQSHIGNNCLVGGFSEVTRSYLGDKVMLHRNYIGDSVLAENVSFGAGAVTANYRFDGKSPKSIVQGKKTETNLPKLGAVVGKNSKIGVNVSILPGVKIGRNSFIGPGEVIKDDIKDSSFIFK